jgi:uncharacterized membrane protein
MAKSEPSTPMASIEEVTARNVAEVGRMERAAETERTVGDVVADRITAYCGSMTFVWTHVAWFVAWVTWNVTRPADAFDPFPFPFLIFVVSLEAIFLSTFILMTENRQARLAERRSHLDLQINLLAEQENTKMLKLLTEIARKVGVELEDAEIAALGEPTDPDRLAKQIDRTVASGKPPGS